jgi:ribosomal protein S4E
MNDAGAASIVDLEGNNIFEYKNEADPNPYQVEHDKLFASIRNNEVINNAEYGAKSTMTAILGRMATYSGKIVHWDEALKSELELMPPELDWNSTPPSLPGADGNYPIPQPGITDVM